MAGLFFLLLLLLSLVSPALAQTPLTLTERIQAQEKIERVYYNHRIWPDNKSIKPSFDQMISRSIIGQKVIDSLKKSEALQILWKRSITPEMLQQEMDRIARTTKDPEMLRELFSALNNDPVLIAEVLARQTLADRLIRNWYAFDQRFHADSRAFVHSIQGKNQSLPGGYSTVTIELAPQSATNKSNRIQLSKEEFTNLKKQYPKLNHIYLKENYDSFVLTRISNESDNQFDLQLLNIPKKSFTQWWEKVAPTISLTNTTFNPSHYELPSINIDLTCEAWEDVDSLNGSALINRVDHTAVWTGTEMIIWGGQSNYVYLNSGARYNPATDTWTPTSTAVNVPFPRQSHTAVWTGSEMIIWGGYNGAPLDTGARYDPVNDAWTPISSAAAPSPRFGHKAVWTGTAMIIWGGIGDVFQTTLNSGGIYTISSDSWQATSTANAPSARESHTAVWTGTEMLIWGGDAGSFTPLGDGGRYNPQSDSWNPISTGVNSPGPRRDHTAVWTGVEMIVWGGLTANGLTNDGGRYNPSSDSWIATSAGSGVPGGRESHTAIWTGTNMIIWGGVEENIGEVNTGASYDPVTDSWLTIAPTSIKARQAHTAIWTGSEMIVWGGTHDYYREYLQDGARYSPSSDNWVEVNPGNNAPSERTEHTAIWTGTEMIIWGGGYPAVNTGGIYDVAINDWTPTSITNAPEPRASHTAVWTGTEMIVWGGYDFNQWFNTGGRYDPITDTWTPTSTGSNVPEARIDHVAVWTGTEMIVWGGDPTVNTGGRYDPLTDSWQPTSTGANVPDGRQNPTAVWTGTEMIVWGGGDYEFSTTSTGGRYNPSTDTWLPTSLTNVPRDRVGQSAIWTGNEMIVWGGISAGFFFPERIGGRYDPLNDTWQPTSIGSVYGRSLHSAVWTGNEMIVWGGGISHYDSSAVNIGGRYNPATDSWNSTAIESNTPTARLKHTAVWTGSKMIVWGGGVTSVGLNSGGVYSPDQDTISLTPKTVPNAEVGTPYSQTISASGGTAPYKYFLVAGSLPCGLTLDNDSGLISGTPVDCGEDEGGFFFLSASDSNACVGSEYYSLIKCPVITFSPLFLPPGNIAAFYNQTITPSGGLDPYLFSITAGALPDGLTLDVSTGVISGTPTTIGTFNFTVTAVDIITCAKSHDYTINIYGPCLLCGDFEDGVMDPNWTVLKTSWNESGGSLNGIPDRKKAVIIARPIFAGCQTCLEESAIVSAGGIGNKVWMLGWYVDKQNTMELLFKEENDKIVLRQRVNGQIIAKNKGSIPLDPNVSYIMKVVFDGTIFTVYVNNTLLFTLTPKAPVPSGTIGFQVKGTTGSFGYITVN